MTYLICLISGFVTALPFVFGELSLISWFSMIPLFYIAAKYRHPYRHGIVFSLGYYCTLFYWFVYLYPLDFAGFTKLQAIAIIALALTALPLLQGIGTAFVPLLYSLLRTKHKFLSPITAAALWVIFEWLQTLFWFGVPWGRLAITQTAVPIAIQSASLFGSMFVSFLIVLSNGFFTLAFEKLKEESKPGKYSVIGAAIIILNYIFGAISVSAYNKNSSDNTVKAACIQGNIGSTDKWADDSVSNSLKVYTELTNQAVSEVSPDIIVWTETAIPCVIKNYDFIIKQISDLAVSSDAIILTGAFDTEPNESKPSGVNSYNAIIAFYPDGTVSETSYKKRHLVPFGEYLPMANLIKKLLPSLAEINRFSDDVTPGTDSELFDTKYGKIGGIVCFESIYETITLDSVRDGAELITIVTNDSWYRDSAAVYQHNSHAILRAVENGRYVVRAANTGISSIISGAGEVKEELEPLVKGYISGNVSFSDSKTLYSRVGNIIVPISAAYCIAIAIFKICGKIKADKGKKS